MWYIVCEVRCSLPTSRTYKREDYLKRSTHAKLTLAQPMIDLNANVDRP